MSANDTILGQKLSGAGDRDAIHIAVIPVQALWKLLPGQHIALDKNGKAVQDIINNTPIGIVDPFLKEPVYPGQWFYLCLYQRSVTGMKHHWQHPSFPETAPTTDKTKSESEEWLVNFARNVEGLGMTYKSLMAAAEDYLLTGDDYCFGNEIDYSTDYEEFWKHYFNVTGKKPEDPSTAHFFRCAC